VSFRLVRMLILCTY